MQIELAMDKLAFSNDIFEKLKKTLALTFLENGPMMEGVSLVNLGHNQTLFLQGDAAESCFLVVSGSIKIVSMSKNCESILTIISKGEFGGVLLMADQSAKYPGSVVALSQTSVLTIPKITLNNHWMKNSEALKFINICVRNRMKQLQEDRLLRLSSVETRVIGFLQRHYIEKNDLHSKKITRKEIAVAVGAKTETIIRVLKKLERAGAIKTHRSIISILDKSHLVMDLDNGN